MKLSRIGFAAILGLGLMFSVNAASLASPMDPYADFPEGAKLLKGGQERGPALDKNPAEFSTGPVFLRALPGLQAGLDGGCFVVPQAALTSIGLYSDGLDGGKFHLNLDSLARDINPFASLHFSGKKLLSELYNSIELQWTESSYAQAVFAAPTAPADEEAPVASALIPNFMILLGSGLLGIIVIRRRKTS